MYPIAIEDVYAAEQRIRPYLAETPFAHYPLLDECVGQGIRVYAKQENFNVTNAFKIRNAFSFLTALPDEARARGIVAATRGNHGLGLAYAAQMLGVRATLCVPVGNNPDKNAGMRAYGARVIEEGRDYEEATRVADRIVRDEGATLAHSTNDRQIIAGAATLSLEAVRQVPEVDAMVIAIGGGSQAVGALVVARALKPSLRVYGVQAERAAAIHDSWHAKKRISYERCDTFADGLATRSTYDLTFPALLDGLAGFVTVSDAEIAAAMRMLLSTTHSLVEGAGAAGLAGLLRLRESLAGARVGIVLSGGNVDAATLRDVITHVR